MWGSFKFKEVRVHFPTGSSERAMTSLFLTNKSKRLFNCYGSCSVRNDSGWDLILSIKMFLYTSFNWGDVKPLEVVTWLIWWTHDFKILLEYMGLAVVMVVFLFKVIGDSPRLKQSKSIIPFLAKEKVAPNNNEPFARKLEFLFVIKAKFSIGIEFVEEVTRTGKT